MMESAHQYSLAMLKKGQGFQAELRRREAENQKKIEDSKNKVREHISKISKKGLETEKKVETDDQVEYVNNKDVTPIEQNEHIKLHASEEKGA